jgi:3-methyladenine DNA glycosylase AlkD
MAAADEIEARLRALGTPERAQGEKRYLKSSLDFLGVRVPDVRREVRAVARMIDSHDELVSLVEDLWSAPVHERRLAAALLLDTRADLLGPDDLVLIERLVRESKTWALVDVLAGTVLGKILLAHPEAADDLDRWASDDDFWIRRSALLSQGKPLKEGAPFDRFARYADSMLDEREFFIRKAIGWVLRTIARRSPDDAAAVRAFLAANGDELSPLSKREALARVKH